MLKMIGLLLAFVVVATQQPVFCQIAGGGGDEVKQAQISHVYIVKQAYILLKDQIGADVPGMVGHVDCGSDFGSAALLPIGSAQCITTGAYRER